MRTAALIVVLVLAGGCDRAEPEVTPSTKPTMPAAQTISTTDFDVALPVGWKPVPSESGAGVFVYQAPDGNARLTLSVARDTAPSGARDLQADVLQISSIRRKAESDQSRTLKLSDVEVANSTSAPSRKWRGTDASAARRTATLVQLANAKLYTAYLECLDLSDVAAKQLSDQVFGSFAAK